MKTNRLFALGLMMALASGACGGDDSGTKPTGDGGQTGTNPDGGPVFGPDGGPINPGGGDGGGGGGDGGGDVTTGTGSATITAAGGSVTSTDGRLTVTFSRYALGRPTKVEIKTVTPAPEGAIGTVYEISPAQEPLLTNNNAFTTVTLKYNAADLGGGSPQDIKVGRFILGRWEELTNQDRAKITKANPSAMSVTAPVAALGQIGIFGGFCLTCPQPACTPENCLIGMPAVAGKCVPTGNGCSVCRPTCDGDNDGFCTQGQFAGDCDDSNAKVRPNGGDNNGPGIQTGDWPELCDGIDNNCQNGVDEGCKTCKTTADCGDSFRTCENGLCIVCGTGCNPGDACLQGNAPATIPGRCAPYGTNNTCSQCRAACDLDGDGACPTQDMLHNIQGGDCDEADANVRQGFNEICGNGKDDDCNGSIDDNCGTCTTSADCKVAGTLCSAGACLACSTTTCDPATCVVDGIAGRCAAVGNGCSVCVAACDGDADGRCTSQGDCDDANPGISPVAVEICGNGVDEDCDGHKDEGCTACADDTTCTIGQEACQKGVCDTCGTCNPADCKIPGYVNPGEGQLPGMCVPFGKGCSKCVPAGDADADGFVTTAIAAAAAAAVPPVVLPGGDCDDTDAKIHPSTNDFPVIELCGNMKDDNCNGVTDELCDECANSMMCGAPGVCSNTR